MVVMVGTDRHGSRNSSCEVYILIHRYLGERDWAQCEYLKTSKPTGSDTDLPQGHRCTNKATTLNPS